MSKFSTFWSGLPKWAKGIIALLVVGIIGLIIYAIYKAIKKSNQDRQFNQDYNTLVTQQGEQPSYPSTDYTTFADKIYAAGCSGIFCYGTDEQAIFDVFDKMNNDLDVILLVQAFGLRQERGGVCVPVPGTGSCDIALGEWLQTELSSDDFNTINTMLKNKHIKYQF